MKHQVVALLSLVGGVFGFGLAGLIQLQPTTLTTPRSPNSETTTALVMPARKNTQGPAEPPARTEEASPAAHVISLEPVLITGRRSRLPRAGESPLEPAGSAAPLPTAPAIPDT